MRGTRAASLDLDPFRVPRVTEWAGEKTLALGGDDIEDGSLSVAIAPRSQLVNQVDVRFDYRYPRLKIQGYPVSYAYAANWYVEIGIEGRHLLTRAAVESAISSAGATVQGKINWMPLPGSFNQPGTDYVWVAPAPEIAEQLCRGFSALCTFDYAKYNEEAHQITVANAASIEKVGRRATQLQSSLEGAYMEPVVYEAHTFMTKGKIDKALEPADTLVAGSGITRAKNPTLSPETDRAAADLAMQTLIDIAKTMIVASHRGSRVDFVTPINPDIDLTTFIHLHTDILEACGKVATLTHSMETDTGRAVTQVTLAISSLAGIGIDHPETETAAPEADPPEETPLPPRYTCTFDNLPEESHEFAIEFEGIEAAERAKTVKEIQTEYAASVLEDLFILEF